MFFGRETPPFTVMTSEERDLITGLFNRLRTADTQQRDAEADTLIQQSVAGQPGAPYLLVQTLLVQEHALVNAQARIKELERQLAAASAARAPQPAAHSGGFLSGLFGGSSATPPAGGNIPPQSLPAASPAASMPYPSTTAMPASASGGFLRSALTTAAGVAGGAMLFQGIEGLLGHRSGAFGSGLGGGGGFLDTGFGGSGGGRPEEIIENNYYGNQDNVPQQAMENDPGLQPAAADYQDTGFTSGTDDLSAGSDPGYDAPPDDSSYTDNSGDSGSGDYSSDDSSAV